MSDSIRTRNEIPAKYKWNAASIFSSDDDWNKAADDLLLKLSEVTNMAGKIGASAQTLAQALEARYALLEDTGKVINYAFLSQAVDSTDANATRMLGKMQSVAGQVYAKL